MKTALTVSIALAGSALAAPPVILVQPAKPAPVISPRISTTSQVNQQLLNQINATLAQRRIEHQIVTTRAALLTQPAAVTPRVIIQRK